MKPIRSPRMTLAAALGTALLAVASASAQTTVFYSNAGSGSNAVAGGATSAGTLAAINYDSWQYRVADGAVSDGGSMSAAPANFPVSAFFQNYTASGLATTLGGETLQSVTLYLFAESVNPNGSTPAYTLYDGLNGTGGAIGTVSLNADIDNVFFSVTVSAAQFAAGFSIGSTVVNGILNVSTEENLASFQTPGLSATYSAVPEPSAVLLGAVGAFGLLRRRRA